MADSWDAPGGRRGNHCCHLQWHHRHHLRHPDHHRLPHHPHLHHNITLGKKWPLVGAVVVTEIR